MKEFNDEQRLLISRAEYKKYMEEKQLWLNPKIPIQ